MTTAQLVLSIIYFIIALALIAIVMLQSGKSAGLSGTIAGGADTFLSKNKAKSADARMAKMTKWGAILCVGPTLVFGFARVRGTKKRLCGGELLGAPPSSLFSAFQP